jgi:hypothetical protein
VAVSLRRRLVLLLLVVGLVSQVGCGTRTSYKVSGQAQYKDGSPITGGVRIIRLEPTTSSTAAIRKVATGEIGSDGSFDLFTRKPGDGVIPGKYAVLFTVLDKPVGGKLLIPAKYNSAADTPFEITVDSDKIGLTYELEKQ